MGRGISVTAQPPSRPNSSVSPAANSDLSSVGRMAQSCSPSGVFLGETGKEPTSETELRPHSLSFLRNKSLGGRTTKMYSEVSRGDPLYLRKRKQTALPPGKASAHVLHNTTSGGRLHHRDSCSQCAPATKSESEHQCPSSLPQFSNLHTSKH